MRKIRNIFKILILCLFTVSCSGGLDGFKLKKKSTSGDEFLIEKKDPLVLPPDFSKNEKPKSEENKSSEMSNSSLEKSILKKIQKN